MQFDTPQRNAVAMLFLKLRDHQNTAAEVLWGVWLALGGFAYVILSFMGELLPRYQGKVFTYAQPAFLGEVAIMLWLVIKGAQPRSLRS
jgi:hypothetical protein